MWSLFSWISQKREITLDESAKVLNFFFKDRFIFLLINVQITARPGYFFINRLIMSKCFRLKC
jgi:hypothetical protein